MRHMIRGYLISKGILCLILLFAVTSGNSKTPDIAVQPEYPYEGAHYEMYFTQYTEPGAGSDRSDLNHILGLGLAILLVPGSIFIYVYFYRRYGFRYKPVAGLRNIRYTPPSEMPPALVRTLMLGPLSNEPDKLALGITLFDLSRRGYFRIAEKSGNKKFLGNEIPVYSLEKTGKKPHHTLNSWEYMLWEKVTSRIDEGITRMDQILELPTRSGKKWWRKWRKVYKKTIRETGWFDPFGSKVMFFHAAAQFPFLIGSVAATLLAGTAGAIALIITAIMMSLTLTLYRYTQDGVNTRTVWSAYRKALKKNPAHSFVQQEMDRHFVFAIALGFTKKQLEKLMGEIQPDNPLFIWIVPKSSSSHPADIAAGLSKLATSGTGSFSGLTGSGRAAN